MHANSLGGACNWPLKGGTRLKEVAATTGGTVHRCVSLDAKSSCGVLVYRFSSMTEEIMCIFDDI